MNTVFRISLFYLTLMLGIKSINSQMLPINHLCKWGYINVDGKIKIRPQYENAGLFNNGLAPVCLNGKWGIIDTLNRFVINPKFDYIHPFSYNISRAILRDSIFLINQKSKVIFQGNKNDYNVEDCFEGYSKILKLNKVNLIDSVGNILFKSWYDDLGYKFSDDLIPAKLGNYWGIINSREEVVVPFKHLHIDNYYDGMALVQTVDSFYTYADMAGTISENKFNDGSFFSCNLAVVGLKRNNRMLYGIINREFENVITPRYEYIGYFSNNRALFIQNNKYGYLDSLGKVIIDNQFEFATNFINGYAVIKKDNSQYLIDVNGKVLIGPYPKLYHMFTVLNGVMFFVKEGSLERLMLKNDCNVKYGYVNLKGNVIWENK